MWNCTSQSELRRLPPDHLPCAVSRSITKYPPKYVHSSLGDSCSLFYLLQKFMLNLMETCMALFHLTDFSPLGCLSFKCVLKEWGKSLLSCWRMGHNQEKVYSLASLGKYLSGYLLINHLHELKVWTKPAYVLQCDKKVMFWEVWFGGWGLSVVGAAGWCFSGFVHPDILARVEGSDCSPGRERKKR